MSSKTRQQLEKWLGEISVPNNSRVLDIGGSQNPIQGRLKNKGENTEYKILDLAQPHECKQKPDLAGNVNEALWCDIDIYEIEDKFDTVFCIEVSEYWYDPYEAIENINYFLKKGGILYISFHFIYPMHNPIEEDCLRYTRFGCIKLLEKAGFKIDKITPRMAEEMSPTQFYSAEGMRPTKNVSFHNEVGYLIKAIKL